MLRTIAIKGYRSIRELILPLDQLTLITGPNGSGKSSVYRSLRLLADTALNQVTSSLANEGGLASTLWAGLPVITQGVRDGTYKIEGPASFKPISLSLGFAADDYSYSIDLGYQSANEHSTLFLLDPVIKREAIWHGPIYRRSAALVERYGNMATVQGEDKKTPRIITDALGSTDSMLATIADPVRAPEMIVVREAVRGWRFYDHFRSDVNAPARNSQIGTFSPVLHHDGSNLAAALQTIMEVGDREALRATINDAFPGSTVEISRDNARFHLALEQPGLLRPLAAHELSDGTLRYLLWTAALLTPRPPQLMVLNEPETSLHPDLLPALARLILAAAQRTQLILVTHSATLIESISPSPLCRHIKLQKDLGETIIEGATRIGTPAWAWPKR
jgi:predicted ATPase